MDALPLPQVDTSNLVIAALGVVVAWLAYRAGVRSHVSQMRVEARTAADKANHLLTNIALEPAELLKGYKAVHSAKGMLNSSATEAKRLEFEDAGAAIADLQAELAIAVVGVGKLSGRSLEDRLVLLRSIYSRAGSLREKFAEHQDNLRRQRETIMNQIQASWAKPEAGSSDLTRRP